MLLLIESTCIKIVLIPSENEREDNYRQNTSTDFWKTKSRWRDGEVATEPRNPPPQKSYNLKAWRGVYLRIILKVVKICWVWTRWTNSSSEKTDENKHLYKLCHGSTHSLWVRGLLYEPENWGTGWKFVYSGYLYSTYYGTYIPLTVC